MYNDETMKRDEIKKAVEVMVPGKKGPGKKDPGIQHRSS